MELKELVSQTVQQIIDGIIEAEKCSNSHLSNQGAIRPASKVHFTVQIETDGKQFEIINSNNLEGHEVQDSPTFRDANASAGYLSKVLFEIHVSQHSRKTRYALI